MDAKSFISNKHAAAVESLVVIEAEYRAKKEAAQAEIDLAKKWLDELGGEKISAPEVSKPASNTWVSNRDLTPTGRES